MAYKIGPSGKAIVAVLVVVAILIPILLTGVLVYGLQPSYTPPAPAAPPATSTAASTTGASSTNGVTVIMPQGVGDDKSLDFSPATINVATGTSITFVDQDTSAPHDVVWDTVPSGASPANSPEVMTTGNSYSITLTVAGTYTYHCAFHAGWMKGTIVVVSPLS